MLLKTKITLQFVGVVAALVLLSFLVIYVSSSNHRTKEYYEALETKSENVINLFVQVNKVDSALLNMVNRTEKEQLYNEFTKIFDSSGTELYASHIHKSLRLTNALRKRVLKGETVYFNERDFECMSTKIVVSGEAFLVLSGAQDIRGKSKLINLRNTLIFLFLAIVILLTIAGNWFSGRALMPMNTVVKQVHELSPENLELRLAEHRNEDEIGKLVSAFNQLLQRIENAIRSQQMFLAGASHELKNPLTTITSQLEVTLKKERSNEEYRQILLSVLEDIRELNRITLQLIELSRVKLNRAEIPMEPVRLDEILWETRDDFQSRHPGFHFDFQFISLPENESELTCTGNGTLLKTAFYNLAENACKFSPDHRVTVSLDCRNQGVNIHFADNGPGIESEEFDLVAKPFYRSVTTSNQKGHGIGLALVDSIVELHQATWSLENRSDGLTVHCSFPSVAIGHSAG